MIQRQKLIGIVASVALAAIGTGLLVFYVRGAEDRALKGEKTVSLLVVSDSIAKGTKAEDIAGKVRSEKVPVKVAAGGAVGSLSSLAGKVATVDLLPGEQLVSGRFSTSGSVATSIAPGMLQVTVSLDMVRAMGGEVREGDTVGVLASFDDPQTTHLVLHKVAVTAVRNQTGAVVTTNPQGAVSPSGLFVTLALDAPSVEKVVFAAEHGRLWLSREPTAADESGTKVQSKAAINA